jgi:NADPH-dependent curcumin reductase CurA
MNEGASYAPPQPLNEVLIGGTVGEFVDSCNARFEVGDTVLGMGGWQQYSVIDDGNSNRVPLCMGDEVPLPGADGRDRGASTRVGVGDV